MTTPAPGTPTQVAHPWQATIRTVAAYVAAVVLLLIAAIPLVNEHLGPYLPDDWEARAGAAAFFGALVALFVLLATAEREG